MIAEHIYTMPRRKWLGVAKMQTHRDKGTSETLNSSLLTHAWASTELMRRDEQHRNDPDSMSFMK